MVTKELTIGGCSGHEKHVGFVGGGSLRLVDHVVVLGVLHVLRMEGAAVVVG